MSVEERAPLIEQRADPFIVRTQDGRYVFIATVPEYDRIELRSADTIAGLRDAEPKTVWRQHESGEMGSHIWAPELHYVDGAWRIYFAAGDAEDVWRIRIYVLSNPSSDPMQGEWQEEGRVKTAMDSFSLDATTFEHNGQRYLVWAQSLPRGRHNTGLLMSKMASATTLEGAEIVLTEPELDWEIRGHYVNEGPAVIEHDGRIFITYSASATDANYAVGYVWANADDDLMDPKNWRKAQAPVFSTNERVGRFGPGHNSFVTDEDGSVYVVYHARTYKEIEGNPLDDPNRHAFIRPLKWTAEGFPDFGQDLP